MLRLDIENEKILTAFRGMRYKNRTNDRYVNMFKVVKENLLPELKDRVEFAIADRVTPMAFFAVDILTISDSTFIKVQHYLHEKEAATETISYVVKPGSPIFPILKNQIEILWENRC
jgi:hypothetical protein